MAYNHLFNDVLKKEAHMTIQPLLDHKANIEVGCYVLGEGKTVYYLSLIHIYGFETCEGLITVDLLRRAGLTIDMISMNETLTVLSLIHI